MTEVRDWLRISDSEMERHSQFCAQELLRRMAMTDYGEPWTIVSASSGVCGLADRGGHAPVYAEGNYLGSNWENVRVPLDRIVACVNACQGIPTEELLKCKLRLRIPSIMAMCGTQEQLANRDPSRRELPLKTGRAITNLLTFGSVGTQEEDLEEVEELLRDLGAAIVADYRLCLRDGSLTSLKSESI